MARIYSTGFELGSSTSGVEYDTNGSATVSTDVVRSGTYALKADANTSVAYMVHTFQNDAVNTTIHRGYMYIDTLPASTIKIFAFLDSGSAVGYSLELNSDGTVGVVADINGATQLSVSSALSTSTWYRLEVKIVDDAASAAQVEWKIDGSTIGTHTGLVGLSGGGQIRWGAVQNNSSALLYFDDIAVNDTAGSAQTDYPGAGSIVHMHPDGAGDNNNASSGTYADVDEVTPDDATTYAVLDANNDILDVTTQSSDSAGIGSSSTITLVQVGIRERAATAAQESWQVRLKSASGGTTSTSATTTHNDVTWRTNGDASPRNYKLTSYLDPTTGVAWTPTGTNSLDNMQIGVQAIDATPDIWVTTLWALVEYIPGSGSTSASVSPSSSSSPSLSPSASRSPSSSISASVSPSASSSLSSSASLSPSSSISPSISPSSSRSPSASSSASVSPSASRSPSASSSPSQSPSASLSPSSSISASISPSSSTSPSASSSRSLSPSASISPSASRSPSSSASPSLGLPSTSPSSSRSPSSSISPSASISASISPSSSISPSASSSSSLSPSASTSPSASSSPSLSPSSSISSSISPSSSTSASTSPSASGSSSLSPSASISRSVSPSSSASSSESTSISPSASLSASVSPSSSESPSPSSSPSAAFELPTSNITITEQEDYIIAVKAPPTELTIID